MATSTTNLGLTKPAGTDKIRIAQINGNMDILDDKIGAVGNTSLQAQITSQNQAIATIGALPSDTTTVTSLDAIKTVLKNTFDGIASGARKTVTFVTNNYSGDYFEIGKRYAGILEKTSLTSATCRLSNNNSHFVTVGLVVSSGTYTWTFTSLSDQIRKISVGLNNTSAATTVPNGTFKTIQSFQAPEDGVYIVVATAQFSSDTNGLRILVVGTNSTEENSVTNSVVATGRATLQRVQPFGLTTSDTVYIRVYQTSGSDMSVATSYRLVRLR